MGCRCSRCREGKLFQNGVSFNLKKNTLMNKECPVCGQPTEIEVGFYYGTSYVSYALAIAISTMKSVSKSKKVSRGERDAKEIAERRA